MFSVAVLFAAILRSVTKYIASLQDGHLFRLPVAHYNQHRKLQDAAFSTEGPPVKEGACLHAVETVNSRLADTCSIVGSLVIFGYMWFAFLTFSYTLSLCVLVLFICVSVFESFPTGLVGQTSQVSRNSSKASKVTGPGC